MNYRLDIQYDGTRYGGWQKQKDTDNTIQGKIEEVLSRMCQTPVTIQGAGRTDAGVHAADRFHSRLNAREKVYQYRVAAGSHKNVFERKYQCPLHENLDVPAMREAAEFLTGTHDFKSFCSNKKMKKSSVRTIYDIEIREEGQEIRMTYTGDGFLYNMVRILTGTLIEVGRGERKPEEMMEILERCDRGAAGFTAPARGLTLLEVRY